MKRFLMFVLMGLAVFNSCSDSELLTPGDEFQIPMDPGTFIVDIEDETTDFSESAHVNSNDASTHINGSNDLGQSITLSISSKMIKESFNQTTGASILLVLGSGTVNYTNFDENGQLLPLTIRITEIDMADQVVTGSFEGKVYNLSNDETLELTKGKFYKIPFTISDGGDGIFKATFSNGDSEQELDFSNNAQAMGTTTNAVISGENVDEIQTMKISIPDGIEEGMTYTEADEVKFEVQLGTTDNPNDFYTNYDAENDVYLPVSITITEITSDVQGKVIGTFSGTIQKFTDGNDEQIEISNGIIEVPIVTP